MKKTLLIAAAALVVVLSAGVVATSQRAGASARFAASDATYVRKDEVIDGSAYIAGNTVTIDGVIKGDLYCAGQTVTITGSVDGDIICAGQNIDVSGKSGGDMRLAGQTVRLRGESMGSVSVFAEVFETEGTTKVAKDINGAAGTARLVGGYGRDIAMGSQTMTIVGTVGRDVNGDFENLTISSEAKVAGDVRYTSQQDGVIAAGAVGGEVSRTPVGQRSGVGDQTIGGLIFMAVVVTAAVLLAIVAIVALLPKRAEEMTTLARQKPGRVALWGLGLAFVLPPVLLVLLLTGIGAGLAIVLGVVWLLFVLLSGAFVAHFLGTELFKNVKSTVLRALLGGLVLVVLYMIPFINFLTFMVVALFGTGMILALCEKQKLFER